MSVNLTITGGPPCKECGRPSTVWDYDTSVASGIFPTPLRGTYCEEHRPSWLPRYTLLTEEELARSKEENAKLRQLVQGYYELFATTKYKSQSSSVWYGRAEELQVQAQPFVEDK